MDFLEKEPTISGQYYSQLLGRFDDKLKETRSYLAKKKVIELYFIIRTDTDNIAV